MMKYQKTQPETIQEMFGSIAKNYDRTNAIMSFQMHRLWNRKLVKSVVGEDQPSSLLDLCCGTGEIAFSYLRKNPPETKVLLVDFCKEMLDCAKSKAEKEGLTRYELDYIQADVMKLPLYSGKISHATMAYGIRNVQDPQKCLEEVYRVLAPGGKFGILELTRPSNAFLRFGHKIYLKLVLPLFGEAYQYLSGSIEHFVKPQHIEEMMRITGFSRTRSIPLLGGIATILVGEKVV